MARWEFKLPDIGEGVTEGEIVQWLVKPGDLVKDDQPMVEVMTDKATVTIAAPRAGTVVEARGKVGETVKVHAVLAVFESAATPKSPDSPAADSSKGASDSKPPQSIETTVSYEASELAALAKRKANGTGPDGGHPQTPAAADEGPAATAVGDIRETLPGMGGARKSAPAAAASPGLLDVGYFNEKPLATPATRKIARDLSVDLKRVPPTGPQGRVTKEDVLSFSEEGAPTQRRGTGPQTPGGPVVAPPPHGLPVTLRDPVKIGHAPIPQTGLPEERVPFAGMRRRIALKMATSKQTAAHFTFVEECDVTQLTALRDRIKGTASDRGVRLTYLPLIVKATVAALKKHPILNSALDEVSQEIVYRKYYNIGIATSTDAGLVVPVVKDADKRSLIDVAREIERLAKDAKAGKSRVEDLSGSTFTITSLGAQGGLFATPIINFPEVGILGVHRIKERPVVRNGEITVGHVMLLSLSFDHRIVDGHVGAAFAYEIIGYLENPESLFLEMA
jgi:pyruvate dehydrogenase E2 component (dihydrolipoamide acetyltransferase)